MSFPTNNDVSPMNQNILSFNLPTEACAGMTGADMDRHIDTALRSLGWGGMEDNVPCTPYGQCNVDIDHQGCGSYHANIL